MKTFRYKLFILLFFYSLSWAKPLPLIIDTDMGIDDAMAIAYLSADPTIKLEAITIAPNGLNICPQGAIDLQDLLARIKQSKTPIACGDPTIEVNNRRFPRQWITQSKKVLELNLSNSSTKLIEHNAIDLLHRTLSESSQPLTILTLGPLQNIAALLKEYPEDKKNIKQLVIMGGALKTTGNATPYAEWNFWLAPASANKVLRSKLPITIVPLDSSMQLPMTTQNISSIANSSQPAAKFIATLLSTLEQQGDLAGWYFWDPLAAVITSHLSSADCTKQTVTVMTTGENAGQLKQDRHGVSVNICQAIKPKWFRQYWQHNYSCC